MRVAQAQIQYLNTMHVLAFELLFQVFIQQNDVGEGVILQSLKRLGGGTPILLLSGNDNGNGHILIQTSGDDAGAVGEFVDDQSGDNILVRALEGMQETEQAATRTPTSTPLSSGECLIIHLHEE